MKKKVYEQPQTEILEVKTTEIICTSTPTNGLRIKEDEGFDEEDW